MASEEDKIVIGTIGHLGLGQTSLTTAVLKLLAELPYEHKVIDEDTVFYTERDFDHRHVVDMDICSLYWGRPMAMPIFPRHLSFAHRYYNRIERYKRKQPRHSSSMKRTWTW